MDGDPSALAIVLLAFFLLGIAGATLCWRQAGESDDNE